MPLFSKPMLCLPPLRVYASTKYCATTDMVLQRVWANCYESASYFCAGRFLFAQFPALANLLSPLNPLISLYFSFPFARCAFSQNPRETWVCVILSNVQILLIASGFECDGPKRCYGDCAMV